MSTNATQIAESQENQQTGISGFGTSVIKLTDRKTGEAIAFIGKLNNEDKIHFPRSLSFDQAEAVLDFISKKKFNRYMSKENFDKAQKFADRKF